MVLCTKASVKGIGAWWQLSPSVSRLRACGATVNFSDSQRERQWLLCKSTAGLSWWICGDLVRRFSGNLWNAVVWRLATAAANSLAPSLAYQFVNSLSQGHQKPLSLPGFDTPTAIIRDQIDGLGAVQNCRHSKLWGIVIVPEKKGLCSHYGWMNVILVKMDFRW